MITPESQFWFDRAWTHGELLRDLDFAINALEKSNQGIGPELSLMGLVGVVERLRFEMRKRLGLSPQC